MDFFCHFSLSLPILMIYCKSPAMFCALFRKPSVYRLKRSRKMKYTEKKSIFPSHIVKINVSIIVVGAADDTVQIIEKRLSKLFKISFFHYFVVSIFNFLIYRLCVCVCCCVCLIHSRGKKREQKKSWFEDGVKL